MPTAIAVPANNATIIAAITTKVSVIRDGRPSWFQDD
jgi:hypothetical protein